MNLSETYAALPLDEKANVITHGIGLIIALVATPFLLSSESNYTQFLGLCLFCFGVAFMFLSSTVYHFANKEILKNKWNVIDHISIFILIGCSYTPFILYYYNTTEGRNFLILHWFIILIGIIFKLVFKTKYEIFSLMLYIALGWMVLFIIGPILSNMSSAVKFWLFAGGISYTVGVYFFVQTRIVWHHAIWHLFVMAGCASHFIALYYSR